MPVTFVHRLPVVAFDFATPIPNENLLGTNRNDNRLSHVQFNRYVNADDAKPMNKNIVKKYLIMTVSLSVTPLVNVSYGEVCNLQTIWIRRLSDRLMLVVDGVPLFQRFGLFLAE